MYRNLLSIIILAISYVLCRFVFFNLDWHGMKSWPSVLAIVGLFIIVVAMIGNKKYLPFIVDGGYLIGFFVGKIFNVDGVDLGGGATSNLWEIWSIFFVSSIILGCLFEHLIRVRKRLPKK